MVIPNWATMHVASKLESRAHFVALESSRRMTVSDRWKIFVSKTEGPWRVDKNPVWQFTVPADFDDLDFIVCVTPNYDCFVIPTGDVYLDAKRIIITWPKARKSGPFLETHENWRQFSDLRIA